MIGDLEYQKKFEKNFKSFAESLSTLQELIFFTESQINKFRDLTDQVIYNIHRQILEDFNSIIVLVGNGFGRNSMKILRSMFEHCVTLKFLSEFPNEVERFCDYQHITRRKTFQKLKESYDEILPAKEFEHIEQNYQRVKDNFMIVRCKKCNDIGLDHKWSKLDMVAMAKKVNLDKTLTFFCYTNPLLYSHPSAQSIIDRVTENSDGAIEYIFESPEDERKSLMFSHIMLLTSYEVLYKQFAIDDKKKVTGKI